MAKKDDKQPKPQQPEAAPKPPLQNVSPGQGGKKKTKAESEPVSPLLGRSTPQAQQGGEAPGKPTMVSGTGAPAAPTMIAGGAQGQPTMIAGGAQGQPTMIASGQGQPTMIATQQGKPTMVATQSGKPTMIGTQSGKATMIAPPEEMQAPEGGAPAKPGAAPTQVAKGAAQPTMLSKAGGKTMLAPPEQQPFDVEGAATIADPKGTMLAKSAGKTQVAPTGRPTTLAPPGQQGPMALPEGSPQGTILAKDAAKATMLAKSGQPTSLAPPGAEPLPLPTSPKKTSMAPTGHPTTLAPPDEESLPLPVTQKLTSMAPTGQLTTLAPPDEESLPLPASLKKTSMAPTGRPTTLAPPDEQPMPVPSQKMTMLARSGEPTTLAPPDEESLPLPGKKTGLAPTGTPTTLGPPDEEPIELPGGVKRTVIPQRGTPTILVPEETMAQDAGADQAEVGSVATGLLDSSTKYQMAPAAAPVKPKYGRRWVGGTILGLLIGSAACIGLGLFGVAGFNAPDEWKKAFGLYVEPVTPPGGKTIAQKALELLDRGEFQEAIVEADRGNTTDELTWIKGEARWLKYVKDQEKAQKPLNAKDSAAKDAAAELDSSKAKYYRAALWRGKMAQQLGEPEKAKAAFEEGAKNSKFPAPVFENALIELETAAPNKPADGAMLPRKLNEADALAIVMLVLQAEGDAGKAPEEAGFDFWKALKDANKHNYKDALDELNKAVKFHESHRFQRLRKAQNPLSDPTEEIFLRAAAELKNYWEIREKLSKNYDLTKQTPLEAVESAIASAKEPNEQLKKLIEVAAKELDIKMEKPTSADVEKALKVHGKEVEALKSVKEDLTKQKYVTDDQPDWIKGLKEAVKDAANKQVVKNILERLNKAGVKDDDADKGVGTLITERDDAYALIDKSLKMLEANKYLAADSKRPQLPEGVEAAIEAGRSPLVSAVARAVGALGQAAGDTGMFSGSALDLAQQLAQAKVQLAILDTRLRLVRTPREMMDFWPAVLERRVAKEVLAAAGVDARRVLDDQGATANDKAAAHCIQGMVHRGQAEFEPAKAQLIEAIASPKEANEGPWRKYAEATLRQLTDPNAFFLPFSEELMATGRLAEALEVLKDGVGAFPKDGRLLAQRSLVETDLGVQKSIQTRKRLTAEDLAQARADAKAAIDAGALAEGNYAAGRAAEEAGDRAAAEKHFREAIKAHPAEDRAGSRYRVALGRVLLQFAPPKLGADAPNKPIGMKMPNIDRAQQLRQAIDKQDAAALFVLLTVAAVGPEDDLDVDPAIDEAIRLGDQAIRAGNPEGYLIKGLALARKGLWTEALMTYTDGLRRIIKPDQGAGLFFIVDHHPAFQLPDALRVPDLAVAEKHYANGLREYFLGRYPQAEKELTEAYRNNGQDARILYYLGLARLPQQGKRDQAVVNFQMGALLERQSKPGKSAVGASLERVQGDVRKTLETYRP